MSIARTYTTAKVRKDWTCGKCGDAIRKGIDGRLSFAVGFRGFEQTRCLKPECFPTMSERESSAVASVYAAQEAVDLSTLDTVEDIQTALEEIADACDEVADEYEQNEMYEINEQLQERAEQVRSAGDELRSWSWDGEDDPGIELDCESCDGTGEVDNNDDEASEDYPTVDCEECDGTGVVDNQEAQDAWIEEVRESAQEAIDSMELP